MPETTKACAICVKRHLVVLAVPAGQTRLECRALPPRQDVAMQARFPVVRDDDYCHSDFVLDAEAARDRKAAAAESEALGAKVADTQARAAAQPELGLLPAEPATPPPPPRARRARNVRSEA